MNDPIKLCEKGGCRKIADHAAECSAHPAAAWSFLSDIDKNKLSKAGYATPRGGAKGAYQNHVYRNNRVIIPYEKLEECSLENYLDGFIVRLFPDQVFNADNSLKKLPPYDGTDLVVGENAFVLYRSHELFEKHPPLADWDVRAMVNQNGASVDRRSAGVTDTGHYVLRLPKVGGGSTIKKKAKSKGPAQGIFAPEYATRELNFLSQVVLAWQIIHTVDSPYTADQGFHLKQILDELGLAPGQHFKFFGMMKGEFTSCPLCTAKIQYQDLHDQINLENEDSLMNAGAQVKGATRSTVVNLFHMLPLEYAQLFHAPNWVSWGHATCNSKLGQRRCWSLNELTAHGVKVATIVGDEISTFGWISEDTKMIRSPLGSVWIKITEEQAK